MNFFEDQRRAKAKSKRLYYLFLVLVVLISTFTALALSLLFRYSLFTTTDHVFTHFSWDQFIFDPQIRSSFILLFVLISCVILTVSLFKILKLRRDPSVICRELGATRIGSNNKDFKFKQYRNIVEEMSFASGVPVPQVFFLDDEAINAFACGYDVQNAAICITRGALEKLDRDELQAVVAHEYGHILNGDMKLNLKIVGMITGLIFIYKAGELLLRSRRGRRTSNKNNSSAIGFILMLIGGIGWIGGLFLQAAISRQREFLADASSVQFTRNPMGIVGALKKIYVNARHGLIDTPRAMDVSHMCFAEGYSHFVGFSSHPDIFDRIKAVDKKFKKYHFKEIEVNEILKSWENNKDELKIEKLETTRYKQLNHLIPIFSFLKSLPAQTVEESVLSMIDNSISEIQQMDTGAKLKFLEMISGEIRGLSSEDKKNLKQKIVSQIKSDGKIDFNEFLVYAYLKPSFGEKIPLNSISSSKFSNASSNLLSYICYLGHVNKETIEKSMKIFSYDIRPKEKITYVDLINAVDDLRFCTIDKKEKVIKIIKILLHCDGKISKRENLVWHLIIQSLGVPSISLDDLE